MRKRKLSPLKPYTVETYVMAENAGDALRKSRKMEPDNVYVRGGGERRQQLESAIGFDDGIYEEEEDEA